MSHSLDAQIRAYFDEFDTTLEPIDVEDLTTQPLRTQPGWARRNPVPGWAVALGTFVVLLALVGGVALLVGRGTDEITPVTDPPTTTIVTTKTKTANFICFLLVSLTISS